MLSPKKMKFRKQSKGRIRGTPGTGSHLAFGDFGIMATESGRITARHYVEASKQLGPGRRHGKILVDLKAIEPDELTSSIEQHVKRILLDLCNWVQGRKESTAALSREMMAATRKKSGGCATSAPRLF